MNRVPSLGSSQGCTSPFDIATIVLDMTGFWLRRVLEVTLRRLMSVLLCAEIAISVLYSSKARPV